MKLTVRQSPTLMCTTNGSVTPLALASAAFDVITYAAVIAPVTLVLVPPLPEVPCTLSGTSTALIATAFGVEPAGHGLPGSVVAGGRPPVTAGCTYVPAGVTYVGQRLQAGRALRQHSHDAPGTLLETTGDAVVVQVVAGLLARHRRRHRRGSTCSARTHRCGWCRWLGCTSSPLSRARASHVEVVAVDAEAVDGRPDVDRPDHDRVAWVGPQAAGCPGRRTCTS